jgi:hypothetical protein
MPRLLLLITCLVLLAPDARARIITADPTNYTSSLSMLQPGDTLALSAGTYTRNLTLIGLNGTETQPIVITGDPARTSTVFAAQACCNTVSITQCSYLVIRNLLLDGGNVPVDAVKGEGTAGNWAHHITLEYLTITGYGSDQQVVGISTKCHAWNWIIRKNRIIGAGTGLYLGNSDGDKPFVGGLIEYNLVLNPIGYCMQVKHQNVGVRAAFPGTAVDGRTVIRHNVFCKESGASSGADARPNVLLGAFPPDGPGANDEYEVYGNVFYQNPVEALLQATGNLALYDNIFVNHRDPSGYRAVYVTAQNGFRPRSVRMFHNTIWTVNSAGGVRLYNADPAYRQVCRANAVFAAQPVTNWADTADNVTDSYAAAAQYVTRATTDILALDLFPANGLLTGTASSATLFDGLTAADRDFNGTPYDWTYRGAYGGCCSNPGWALRLDTIPEQLRQTSGMPSAAVGEFGIALYPQPACETITLVLDPPDQTHQHMIICDLLGRVMLQRDVARGHGPVLTIDTQGWPAGVYLLRLDGTASRMRRFVVR